MYLARAVVVVGLPYPNKFAIEMKERMKYYDSLNSELISGNIYYENCCWKAISQSIGRAVRHKDDYAAIILIDQRFANKSTMSNKLPSWISKRVKFVNVVKDSSNQHVLDSDTLTCLSDFYESIE